jgi:quercetin dioxygenase-like cupin family protein
MHYTDSIDLELVIEGSVVLELDNGDHRLEAGDCVVMNGVDHGWRVGPDGCTVLIAILGTPSPRA